MWTCVVDDNMKTLNFCLLEVQCFMFASAMTTIILAETVHALNNLFIDLSKQKSK